jgi:hypothetical protein
VDHDRRQGSKSFSRAATIRTVISSRMACCVGMAETVVLRVGLLIAFPKDKTR